MAIHKDMLTTTHVRTRREKPALAAGLYVNRDLIDVVRNTVRVDGPPTIGTFIPQRHVDYITHGLTFLMGVIRTIMDLHCYNCIARGNLC